MKHTIAFFFLLTTLFTAASQTYQKTANTKGDDKKNEIFTRELSGLKAFFQIPGLSVIIQDGNTTRYENYQGYADLNKQVLMDSTTAIPMASLTKMFSAILVMQLAETNKISLDEPINKYVTNSDIPDSIKIKHVLSHTSQGKVGDNFYYSSRFRWLTSVIEKTYNQDFGSVMQDKILKPLNLKNTFLLRDTLQLLSENRKLASPYFFDGQIKNGFVDFGYSAAAGITSTGRDLAIFSKAIDNNILITAASKIKMLTPFKESFPYGFGIFTQHFLKEKIVWGYGQFDCYSSLFIKIPAKKLTFIIAANNNLISDPARAIYGDVASSLFALCFLKNYVFDLQNIPLLEDENSVLTLRQKINRNNSTFYLKKLLAQSLAESFMGTFDKNRSEKSKIILKQVFKIYPDYQNYGNLSLLHNLTVLKAIAIQNGPGPSRNFDEQIKGIGRRLLSIDINNPYANYYLAKYHEQKGDTKSTFKYFIRIADLKNFTKNWYTREAETWLKKNKPVQTLSK